MINKEDLRVGNSVLYNKEEVSIINIYGTQVAIKYSTARLVNYDDIEGIPLTEETIKKYFPEFEYHRKETYDNVEYSYYRLYRNSHKHVWLEVIFDNDGNTPQITIKMKGQIEIVLNSVPFVHNLQNILQALKR